MSNPSLLVLILVILNSLIQDSQHLRFNVSILMVYFLQLHPQIPLYRAILLTQLLFPTTQDILLVLPQEPQQIEQEHRPLYPQHS